MAEQRTRLTAAQSATVRDNRPTAVSVSTQHRLAPAPTPHACLIVTEITPQSEDFSRWYLDVVRRAELADYSPVKGCMVIRPYGYAIWELIQQALDDRFKATGHVNAYFPLFIPESLLMKEAEHVEGFAPQVAWVTQGGNEELEERLVVRPTSEAIIGTMYAKWMQSWRDLPILINQWANVVRWEKVTRPFLRTTEFLWQEGHTAHETAEEAQDETLKMLGVYKDFAENDARRCRCVDGQKSESEKFAGADAHLLDRGADGRRPRAAGGHVAQPRAELREGVRHHVPGARQVACSTCGRTSWGVSTRLIGGVIMTHGDDSGLILPPKVAPYQVVIVPIPPRQLAGDRAAEGARDRATSCVARRHPRHARRPRRADARLEVRRVGAARRAAAARDRPEGHREVTRCSRRAATPGRRRALPMDGLPAARASAARRRSRRRCSTAPRRSARSTPRASTPTTSSRRSWRAGPASSSRRGAATRRARRR